MRRASSLLASLVVCLPLALAAQAHEVTGHRITTSGQESKLIIDHADGGTTTLVFRNGALTMDGRTIGSSLTAPFSRAWDQTLRDAWSLDTRTLLDQLHDLPDVAPALRARVRELRPGQPHLAATAVAALPDPPAPPRTARVSPAPQPARAQHQTGEVRTGDVTIRPRQLIDGDLTVLDGDLSLYGRVDGNVTLVGGDLLLHDGAEVTGSVSLNGGAVIDRGGRIRGRTRVDRSADAGADSRHIDISLGENGTTLATLASLFIALAGMGFGFTFYLPKQLDLLTDTVRQSSGKSFLAGLFTQPLLVPVFAVGILGLAITVVGILLIPVAIPAMALALIGVATAGYLAVARAIGDHYVNRRLARGIPTRATPYRSMLYGLVALLAAWIPAVVLGWVPVVGQVVTIAAMVFTWIAATTGLGATVLSQAGLRATFRRPAAGHLTDEHFWLPPASSR